MKQIILLIVLLLISWLTTSQNINFIDINLKNYLLTQNCVDTNNDGIFNATADFNNDNEIQISEALAIERLYFFDFDNPNPILSISDLNNFTNLKHLDLLLLELIENFENMQFTGLETLQISSCDNLKRIDISNLPNITNLKIEGQIEFEYLNIQNGTYATDMYSLFYAEYIQYACVDAIANEYQEVAWRMADGVLPQTNCNTALVNSFSLENLQVYPNPSSDFIVFDFDTRLDSITLDL